MTSGGLGGILRSIHRYATDGMILTMLLHMLRHFAYDRYRGFRSFSWLTGVALLWLIYIAGVNGFMLVWDKLAQFVVIATAEWFDILPMFNGTLIRNFLYLESVNSRLFTLLAFIHIGAPLIVAIIMWVHVQRVPRAHINPPRPIAIAVTLMFLALALVKPILSQGGEADMSVVPTNIDFDWFELPVLALVYVVNPLHLWYWVLGLTALLFLFPGYHRSGSARRKALTSITFHPDHKAVSARFGETLLDAGLRQDINLPYECRNGGCGVCKCTVLQGKVDPGLYQPSALSAAELAQGKVLLCCATALEDVEIEYQASTAPKAFQEYSARVVKMEKLTHDVMRVLLKLPEGQQISLQGRAVHQHHPRRRSAARLLVRQPAARGRIRRTADPSDARRPFHDARFRGDEGRRRDPLRGPDRRLQPARIRAADRLRRRRHRLRPGQEHGRGRLPARAQAPNPSLLGRQDLKDLYLPELPALGARTRELPLHSGALRSGARRRLDGAAPAWSMKPFSKTSRNSSSTRSTPAARCAWSKRSSPSSSSTAPKTAPASRMPSASRHGRWPSSRGMA
jgi:ferredoxin